MMRRAIYSLLLFAVCFTPGYAQRPKQPKSKINYGIEYSLMHQRFFFESRILHQVAMVFDYKHVQLSVGGSVQFTTPTYMQRGSQGHPAGLFLNAHYILRKPEAIFNLSFDCMASYFVTRFMTTEQSLHPAVVPTYVTIKSKNAEMMVAMGPGIHIRPLNGLAVKLGVMLSALESNYSEFTWKDGNTGEGNTSRSVQTMFLPQEFYTRLGVTYVFQY